MSVENKFSMRDMETIYNSYTTGTTYSIELMPLSTSKIEGLHFVPLDGKKMMIDVGFESIFKTETVIAPATHPNFITKKTFPMLTADAIRGYREGVHNNIFIPITNKRVYSVICNRLEIEMWTSIAGGKWEKTEKSKLWNCYLINYEILSPFKYPYVEETKGILLRTRLLPTGYMDRSMVGDSKFMIRIFFKHSPSFSFEILRTNSFPIYTPENALQFFAILGTRQLFEKKTLKGKKYTYEELVELKGFHISTVASCRPIKKVTILMNEVRDRIEKERILKEFNNLKTSKDYIGEIDEMKMKRKLEQVDNVVFPPVKKSDSSSCEVDEKFEMQLQEALFQEELMKSFDVVSASIFPFGEYVDDRDDSKLCEDFFFGKCTERPLEKITFSDCAKSKIKEPFVVFSDLKEDLLTIDSFLNDEEFMDELCNLESESI